MTVGYFDQPGQVAPAFDPGLDAQCLACWKPLRGQPRVTISLMWEEWRERSYFFRVHKACWETMSLGERQQYEESILEAERRRLGIAHHV